MMFDGPVELQGGDAGQSPMTGDREPAQTVHAQSLLVICTERLEACREFYTGIGAPLTRDQLIVAIS